MKIEWIKAEAIKDPLLKRVAALFSNHTSRALIQNVDTEIRFIQIQHSLVFPVTINNAEWDNSYVCSPYTAYVTYAKEEAEQKIQNKILRFILKLFISTFGIYLKSTQINKVVHVNNFMLSTNPYPEWKGSHIREVLAFLVKELPGHAIIFRSINDIQHKELLKACVNANMKLIASRQVYIYNEPFTDFMKRNNNYQDQRIIRKKGLIYVSHEEMWGYLEEALHLYNLLYLKKYSKHNPQFTLTYFTESYTLGLIHFQGYKDHTGRLRSFCGLFTQGDTITSPLVGYDTSAPKEDALYIHAIQLIYMYRLNANKTLNLSSGAPLFKRLRGGIPAIEYSAVYVKHLSLFRRSVFVLLKFASNSIGVPLLKKYEL
ncbi:hypothetical protein [Cytophaga aurantiaca]|uniref:hypothetical protein n=1 Tax=Cytophaga aurantiaca TaxID=29530 RepID=UPI000378C596|nr:hypothetical protein [Cytophaga aurantiaca]